MLSGLGSGDGSGVSSGVGSRVGFGVGSDVGAGTGSGGTPGVEVELLEHPNTRENNVISAVSKNNNLRFFINSSTSENAS